MLNNPGYQKCENSTRVYLVDPLVKGNKGGFAIGGYGNLKEAADNYFFINPDSSRFYVRKPDATSSTTFDIIGIDENQYRKSLLSANADTVGIQGVLNLQNDLVVGGNINVGGNVQPIVNSCVDADGNVYATVLTVNDQVVMAENLRTTRYSNGDLIGTTTLPGDTITGEIDPKYQWAYDGNEANAPVYGRLYTWAAVTDSRNICPSGYHVTSIYEWQNFFMTMEYAGYGYEGSGNDIAKALASTTGWVSDPTPGNVGNDQATNNASGLNVLPAGYRDVFNSTFTGMGYSATTWTSTAEGSMTAYCITGNYASSIINTPPAERGMGYSVRCTQDY